MIHDLFLVCLLVGLSTAGPLRKGAYAPAPLGVRPPCATKSMTFCEEIEKYPTKLIQTLLQSKSFDSFDFFTDESEGLDEPPEYVLHQELTSAPIAESKKRKVRSVEDDKLSPICPVQNKTATPKIASNSKGEWRFIAQDELSNVQQKFKVQICNESEECQKSCTQFYTPVKMISVDKGGAASEDTFWMPSSCRCFDVSENMV